MARSYEPTAEGISLLTPYWSSIAGARAQGYNRGETWSIIQEQFQAGGPSYAGATIFDMNAMWARAGEMLNAQTAFGQAAPTDAVTGEMWAWAPWTTPTTADWQTPNYMINYATAAVDAEGNLLVDDNGQPIPVWGATDWQGSIDVTTQDIVDRVMGSAQAALDTGSPGTRNQMQAAGAIGLGDVLAVQILRF
jgi:hypothetical protein